MAASSVSPSTVRERAHHIARALALVWNIAPKLTVGWFLLLVVQGLIPGAIVVTTKWLVDSVAGAFGNGVAWGNIEPVVMPGLVMGALLVLQQGLGSVSGWLMSAMSEVIQDELKAVIHEKAASVDYGFYESSEYFDLLQQADSQASGRTLSLLRNLGTLGQNAITFTSIALILVTYSVWLPVVLVIGMVPALYVVARHQRIYHAWWKSVTRERRWASYLDILFIEPRFAAEMRLYQLGDHFQNEYRNVRKGLREERLRLLRNQSVASIYAVVQGLLVTAGIMLWMGWRALQGLATAGDLALFYQAVNQGQGIVRSFLNSAAQLYSDALFVEHLFRFLEIEPELEEIDEPTPLPDTLTSGIHFKNLTFQYPGGNEPALRDFSLHLPANKITAIVGANGAGKSTLIKLLCRFFDPQRGDITIDGTSIRTVTKQDLWRHISVLFQHPVHFQHTAYHNIALGDREAATPETVQAAARNAGAHEFIERLSNRYDAMLGRLFPDGHELSGGQWQRIALARAYLRRSPIILLDEPTNHVDSWAETEWLARFRELAAGRTALIITHRFTTAMQADVIHVMDEGRLLESGTHEELVARGGHYASSWSAQIREEQETRGDGTAEPPHLTDDFSGLSAETR